MSSHWSNQREKGSYWGMVIMFWLYRLGGDFLFSVVLYPVMTYFFLFSVQARSASLDFLNRAHSQGSPVLETRPGFWHSYAHMMTFARTILDKIAVWVGAIKMNRIEFPDREYLRAKIKEGKGGIFLVSHIGNLEICRAISKQTPSLKLNILVHTHHAEKFNTLLAKVNPDSELSFLQVTEIGPDTAVLLKQKIDAGEFLAIVGDRVPVSQNRRVVKAPFLGELASFPQGPFILAALMKCPVYSLFCVKVGDKFRVEVAPFCELLQLRRKSREQDLQKYIESFACRLQQYAIDYPYQWFNFYKYWSDA